MQVIRTKTISEYKIPEKVSFKFVRNYKTAYYLWKIIGRLREHGKTVSYANKQNPYLTKFYQPKRTFRFEINDTDTAYNRARQNQKMENLMIIADMTEPPKPKYPTLEDYCQYCTDNKCETCSICEQLEEQAERLAQTD
jgi:hypothetical protein